MDEVGRRVVVFAKKYILMGAGECCGCALLHNYDD